MMDSTTTCEATGLREACSLSLHIWPLPDNARPEYGDIHVLNYCNPLLVATQMRQASGALLLQLSTQLYTAGCWSRVKIRHFSGKRDGQDGYLRGPVVCWLSLQAEKSTS